MDCIAAIPCAGGRLARAFIMQAEKAKKNPAISPQPSADKKVRTKSKRSIVTKLLLQPRRS
jgi:hypothetical protein